MSISPDAVPGEWDVSVIIPTLPEREQFFDNAIQSVAAQEYQPYETLIEVVKDGEDAGTTRNHGIENAVSPWLAFLDDDDELEPQHLRVLIEGAKESGADVIYSWFKVLDASGLHIFDDALWFDGAYGRASPFGAVFDDSMAAALLRNNFIHCCCLVKTEMARKAGGFPITNTPEWPMPHSEDWGFWSRLLKHGAKFYHVPERTWHWRHWNGRTNGQPERRVPQHD